MEAVSDAADVGSPEAALSTAAAASGSSAGCEWGGELLVSLSLAVSPSPSPSSSSASDLSLASARRGRFMGEFAGDTLGGRAVGSSLEAAAERLKSPVSRGRFVEDAPVALTPITRSSIRSPNRNVAPELAAVPAEEVVEDDLVGSSEGLVEELNAGSMISAVGPEPNREAVSAPGAFGDGSPLLLIGVGEGEEFAWLESECSAEVGIEEGADADPICLNMVSATPLNADLLNRDFVPPLIIAGCGRSFPFPAILALELS